MAGESSVSQELINAIELPNLKAIRAYLSENDAISVDYFLQCDLASEYAIDTSNVHCGGETHYGHVFNIYAKFSPTKDIVKVRLDMLQYVTAHHKRYDWNAHLYLRMNGLSLDTWVQKMTYCGNGADDLAIYAMSDMVRIHSSILPKNRPWTTIGGDFTGDIYDALKISRLIFSYLGNNKFARVWNKESPDAPSYIQQSFNYSPMVNVYLHLHQYPQTKI